jgi:hypothetical protein
VLLLFRGVAKNEIDDKNHVESKYLMLICVESCVIKYVIVILSKKRVCYTSRSRKLWFYV